MHCPELSGLSSPRGAESDDPVGSGGKDTKKGLTVKHFAISVVDVIIRSESKLCPDQLIQRFRLASTA